MKWRELLSTEQLAGIKEDSFQYPIVIYKHSTRCGTSSVAMNRLERQWTFEDQQLPIYYLDVITQRQLSNQVAEDFDVRHQSPQVLLIKDGKCIYNASHLAISFQQIESHI